MKMAQLSFRKKYATVLLLFIAGSLKAQKTPSIFNMSLTKPEKALLYIGVDNILTVRGPIPGKNIQLERSGGPLQMRAGTSLKTILKYTLEGTDTIRVYSDNKLVIEKVYQIVPLGHFAPALKGRTDSLLTKEDITKSGQLEVIMPDAFYKPSGKILSYTVNVYSPVKKIIGKFKIEGPLFSEELNLKISTLLPGSMLLFENIKAASRDGAIPLTGQFKVTIK
jgi:hypothetical protein